MPKPLPLYPTKTRVALLRQVADGQVYEPSWNPKTFRTVDGTVVTDRVQNMLRAEWVTLAAPTTDLDVRLRQVVPTEAGREILTKNADGGR